MPHEALALHKPALALLRPAMLTKDPHSLTEFASRAALVPGVKNKLSPGVLRHCKVLCRPCQFLRQR